MTRPVRGPVLVTGAGGFLGGHLLRALTGRGIEVRAFDIDLPPDLPEGAVPCLGSVTSDADVEAAMAGVELVIHGAAIAQLWTPRPFDYDIVNVAGTCRVLSAARKAGARVVHVSSYTTLIGRDTEDGLTLDESVELTPTQMLGRYPRSKREAELAVLAAATAGLDALIVMPPAPVGPGDRHMTPPSVMIRDIAAGRTPAIIDCLINLVDIRALAEGVLAAAEHGRAGKRYLLTGEDIPMKALAARIAAIAGVKPPRATAPMALALMAARVESVVSRVTKKPPKAPLSGVRLAARRVRFDASRARDELGFAPPPIDAALEGAIAWMRAEGHLPAA